MCIYTYIYIWEHRGPEPSYPNQGDIPVGVRRLAPPLLGRKTKVLRNVNCVCGVADYCVVGMGGIGPPLPRRKTMFLCCKQEGHVRHVKQQTCPLCHTADMAAVSHSSKTQTSNYFCLAATAKILQKQVCFFLRI